MKLIERKPSTLRYTENGAFDIPNTHESIAMDYYAGKRTLAECKSALLAAGFIYLSVKDDNWLEAYLYRQLRGNERFFTWLSKTEVIRCHSKAAAEQEVGRKLVTDATGQTAGGITWYDGDKKAAYYDSFSKCLRIYHYNDNEK